MKIEPDSRKLAEYPGPYDIINVDINGTITPARPVGWDRDIVTSDGRDKNGMLAVANKYETTCPFTGNLITMDGYFIKYKSFDGRGEIVPFYDDFPDIFRDYNVDLVNIV